MCIRDRTTIGRTLYVTADWDQRDPSERYCTLRHEAVHLQQFRRWTLPGMAIFYLLLPLPVGLAYFRARFETVSYTHLRAHETVLDLVCRLLLDKQNTMH